MGCHGGVLRERARAHCAHPHGRDARRRRPVHAAAVPSPYRLGAAGAARGGTPLNPHRLRRRQNPIHCGVARGEPSPGADAAGVSPFPVQMWPRRAESQRSCGRGEPSQPRLLQDGVDHCIDISPCGRHCVFIRRSPPPSPSSTGTRATGGTRSTHTGLLPSVAQPEQHLPLRRCRPDASCAHISNRHAASSRRRGVSPSLRAVCGGELG